MIKKCKHIWLFARDNNKNGYLMCDKCGKEDWGEHEKYLCNPLDENSTLNMDNGGKVSKSNLTTKVGKDSSDSREPTTPKVHLSKREEFEKLIVEILFANGNTPLQEKKTDELYHWHITEIKKILKRIEKKLCHLIDKKMTKRKAGNLELVYGERWCPVCGYYPEVQRKIILDVVYKQLNNLEDELK